MSRPKLAATLAILAATALAGCGSGSSGSSIGVGQEHKADEALGRAGFSSEQNETPDVELHLDAGSYSTASPEASLGGTVTRGARVRVNGSSAHVTRGHWSVTLPLSQGDNTVEVHAAMKGHNPATGAITITRETLEARERAREQVAAKHAARAAVEKINRECEDPSSKCHKEASEVEAGVRRGEEYERAHKPEEEAKEHEYQRRVRGEFTPEEERHNEEIKKEESEVESVIKHRAAEESANELEGAVSH